MYRQSKAHTVSALQLTIVTVIAVLFGAPGPVTAVQISKPVEISNKYRIGDHVMGVRLLGTVQLDHKKINELNARELSGLAWDADANLLYAVSDGGFLCHFRPRFEHSVLTNVDMVAAYPLLTHGGDSLTDNHADSEGLAIRNGDNQIDGDTELLISFEINPRVLRYHPDGKLIGDEDIPTRLTDIANYAGENDALEGITLDQNHKLLMAPQRPLRQDDQSLLSVYSTGQAPWFFRPIDPRYSSVVGMETTPSGNILILERRYSSLFKPVIWAIRRIDLNHNVPLRKVDEIWTLSNEGSTWNVQNFEGIAHHRDNKYFIVSDDGHNAIQRTLLVYFEILK